MRNQVAELRRQRIKMEAYEVYVRWLEDQAEQILEREWEARERHQEMGRMLRWVQEEVRGARLHGWRLRFRQWDVERRDLERLREREVAWEARGTEARQEWLRWKSRCSDLLTARLAGGRRSRRTSGGSQPEARGDGTRHQGGRGSLLMGAVSSRARESWRRWRAKVWLFLGGDIEGHPGPGPEAHQARTEAEGEQAPRGALPLEEPGHSSGGDEQVEALPEAATAPVLEEAPKAGGETGLVEIVSLNPGTVETNADIALRWQGAAGICVQEARLDLQGQVGLRHEAR